MFWKFHRYKNVHDHFHSVIKLILGVSITIPAIFLFLIALAESAWSERQSKVQSKNSKLQKPEM